MTQNKIEIAQNQQILPHDKLSTLTLRTRPQGSLLPRVLLVHGTMDRSSSFNRMSRYLNDFEVVTYDRRGYGSSIYQDFSGVPLKLTWQIHLEDLTKIINEAPTVVFGHSYGGTLGLLAAERKIHNLIGLITFEAPLPWIEKWARWPHYALDPSEPIEMEWAREQVRRFMIEMIGANNWSRLPPSTRIKRESEGITMVSEMSSLSHLSPPLDPSNIEIPILVARSLDAPQRHVESANYLAGKASHCSLELISGTGHGIHLSRPDEAARLVQDLIRKI